MALLGATGAVGQKFVRLLDRHPQFQITQLMAGDRSAGHSYAEACHWLEDVSMPNDVCDLEVLGDAADIQAEICFSALPGGLAGATERALARRGIPVFTNARDLRMEPDVPLVIAEVNSDHLALARAQQTAGRSRGFVVANGNCTSIVLAMALKPLHDMFGVKTVRVVTMQALSGAGYPGVAALDATENLVPYIEGEEEKVLAETPKFLGRLSGEQITSAKIGLSATCTRVPVLEGHTEAVSVELERRASPVEVVQALRDFRGPPQDLGLPTAPERPIIVRDEADRPQPRRDRGAGNMMSVVVGRVREDPLGGIQFVAMGSNTVRGAAGGSILSAELAQALGYFD